MSQASKTHICNHCLHPSKHSVSEIQLRHWIHFCLTHLSGEEFLEFVPRKTSQVLHEDYFLDGSVGSLPLAPFDDEEYKNAKGR